MSLASLLNTTLSIQSPTATSGTLGGQALTYSTTVHSSVPCTLQPLRGDVIERFAKREIDVDFVAYTDQTLTVGPNYRAVIGGANYTVQHFEDMAGRGRAFALYLLKQD